ncbi:hypothetical protein ACTXI4_02180 [Glutamicibacter ardleyensis]|uniref:hypothetical protein n=1 Tax=Glutamicibacter ardleyensis TaxID=225894 RepID=UPI003FD4D4B3
MTTPSLVGVCKRFTAYIADLNPANRVIAFVTFGAVLLQVLSILGFLQALDSTTLAVISFTLLAILALVLDMQVQQTRALNAAEHDRDQTAKSLAHGTETLDGLLASRAPFDVRPNFIKPELDKLLSLETVRFWKFRGGSGRWQRSVVLPTLAGLHKNDVEYKMLILDPRNENLCGQYAKYRNTHRISPQSLQLNTKDHPRNETTSSVRDELLACVVAAAWYSAKSRVKAQVYLNQTYSPLRLDLSATGVMLTVSDPSEPGLMCRPDSWLYKALDDEFERTIEQSPQILFSHGDALIHPVPNLNSEVVTDILGSARIRVGDDIDFLFTKETIEQLDTANLAKLALDQAVESR